MFGLTSDEERELTALEAAFAHNGGRGVEDAERIDALRRKRGWATEDEAAEEADNLNSMALDVTWQTAYVNDGDDGYWIIVTEEGTDGT